MNINRTNHKLSDSDFVMSPNIELMLKVLREMQKEKCDLFYDRYESGDIDAEYMFEECAIDYDEFCERYKVREELENLKSQDAMSKESVK